MQAVLRRWLKLELMETRDVPAVWYVDPAGADANPGTPAAPLQTLQRAADVVTPGDTVNVRTGTYRGFNLTRSGTAAARITFQADPAAAKGSVVVNQPNAWNNRDGINLEGASYITVDGFTVLNQPRAGIRAVNDQFVTISNNRADNNGDWGIFTGFSDDLTVENNETSRSVRQHGIYVSNSGDRPTVRGNLVWGNAASGIQLNADASMGGDGVISNAMIERNVIHDNGRIGGASINLDGVQSSTVRN
ncbi:MAG: right-handed parallel beta-helix repeat-containing protein, partial [Gemmataceae bacterium]